MHALNHSLDLLRTPGIAAAVVAVWAAAVRFRWRRGKTALQP